MQIPGTSCCHVPQGDVPDTALMLRALYNAVISSSVGDEEDEDALKLLAELLAEDGVDPNALDEKSWETVSPLYVPQGVSLSTLNLNSNREQY